MGITDVETGSGGITRHVVPLSSLMTRVIAVAPSVGVSVLPQAKIQSLSEP